MLEGHKFEPCTAHSIQATTWSTDLGGERMSWRPRHGLPAVSAYIFVASQRVCEGIGVGRELTLSLGECQSGERSTPRSSGPKLRSEPLTDGKLVGSHKRDEPALIVYLHNDVASRVNIVRIRIVKELVGKHVSPAHADQPGSVRNSVCEPSPSVQAAIPESVSELDGELSLCSMPFSRRPFPLGRGHSVFRVLSGKSAKSSTRRMRSRVCTVRSGRRFGTRGTSRATKPQRS
jgi:hypothetical protein